MIPFSTYDVIVRNFECPGVEPGDRLKMSVGAPNGFKFHVSVSVFSDDSKDDMTIAVWDQTTDSPTLVVPETFEVVDHTVMPRFGAGAEGSYDQWKKDRSTIHPVRGVMLTLCTAGPVTVGVSVEPV